MKEFRPNSDLKSSNGSVPRRSNLLTQAEEAAAGKTAADHAAAERREAADRAVAESMEAEDRAAAERRKRNTAKRAAEKAHNAFCEKCGEPLKYCVCEKE